MIHRSELPAVDLRSDPLHHLIHHGLSTRATATAIVDTGTGECISGTEMIARITYATRRFSKAGLRPGDSIGLAAEGGAAWLAAAVGALGAGLTVVPLNPSTPASVAAAQLTAARARAVAADGPSATWAAEAAGTDRTTVRIQADVHIQGEAEALLDGLVDGPDLDPDSNSTAFLLSSSGTTGMPKLARISHRSIGATVQLVPPAVGFGAEDTMLAALPLFHAGGLAIAAIPLAVGARLVIQPGFTPEAFAAAIETHRITATVVVPPICHALATHPAVELHDMSTLRFVQSTAAPLAPAIQRRLADRLGCHVGQGLGLTEALPVSLTVPGEPVVAGSSGRVVPNTEVRLVHPSSGADVVDRDDVGELWVRGPQVMTGYHEDPDATNAALTIDGWLRTGDLCRIDGDGNIFVVDRLKELIKVNGYQVAPAAVEAVLLQHPDVLDCAVIGQPDPRRGEVPVAWVVTRRPIDPRELIRHAALHTAPYARLHEVIETDTIPRNPTGKILRRALRDQRRTVDAEPKS